MSRREPGAELAHSTPTAFTPGLLPLHSISGIGRAAGRAYGESARELVLRHHEIVLRRLSTKGMSHERALAAAQPYREATRTHCPDLAAEVDGVGEGAGLTAVDGWILQLRAELLKMSERDLAECSSLAVTEGTTTLGVLAGQNVDLPPDYEDLFVVLRRDTPGEPALATVTPAGQIGHHGLNEAGLAVFANFLYGPRCHIGVPRYLLTRVAMRHANRHAALQAVAALPRSKPRNLLIADDSGALDAETTPNGVAAIEAVDGLLAHTNHYIARRPGDDETPDAQLLANSTHRLERLSTLMHSPQFRRSISGIVAVLSDRAGAPDGICHRATDTPGLDVATVMMSIADVRARELWISPGGPEVGPMQRFSFVSGVQRAALPSPDGATPQSLESRPPSDPARRADSS